MRRGLATASLLVLFVMVALTVRASLGENVSGAFARAARDRWFLATLADAYFAFLAIGLWAAWLERGWRGAAWCAAVLLLGSAAVATFVLVRLARLRPGDGIEAMVAPRRRL